MRFLTFLFALVPALIGGSAAAELEAVTAEKLGFANKFGLYFVEPASREMESLIWVANGVNIMMVLICVFVLALLIWVAIRYNERVNKEASRTTHSVALEILWTGIPTLIVVVIGVLGVRQILEFERMPALGMVGADGTYNDKEAALVVEINGMPSWNWEYEVKYFGDQAFMDANPSFYEDEPGYLSAEAFKFASNMLEHPDLEKRGPVAPADVERTLATWQQQGRNIDFYQFDVDNRLVIPSGVRILVEVTGPITADKQHAWAVPAFAVKRDFWPGRVNPAHFFVPEGNEGLYFGQCSEFCGAFHAYMPIAVHVVTMDEYRTYMQSQMAAAVAAKENGGVFIPEYLPVELPAPYGSAATALAAN